ncbi:MAG: PTS mannose/fructose/sorbose transporter subunit IIC [Tissierellia bacterium]|nr:PTS mannose/fructose/sorbose transporter subunit IIC [Tissierellia bacterium]
MSTIQIILVIIVAFLAGMEGILDQFQFHQPLVACTLIGLVTGHLKEGVILGGSLQMIALGWANVGAAVAPDAALASVASAIIMVLGLQGGTTNVNNAINTSIAVAIPLSVAGLFLTMLCRTIAIPIVHIMDSAAEEGNYRKIEIWHIIAICMQGVRIAIPAAALCVVSPEVVTDALNKMPDWLSGGMAVGGGMVAAVGYAMVINMMSTKETWPFFALGFVLAALHELTLIALGVIGVALAIIYLGLKEASSNNSSNGGGGSSSDPLGDILNDY